MMNNIDVKRKGPSYSFCHVTE